MSTKTPLNIQMVDLGPERAPLIIEEDIPPSPISSVAQGSIQTHTNALQAPPITASPADPFSVALKPFLSYLNTFENSKRDVVDLQAEYLAATIEVFSSENFKPNRNQVKDAREELGMIDPRMIEVPQIRALVAKLDPIIQLHENIQRTAQMIVEISCLGVKNDSMAKIRSIAEHNTTIISLIEDPTPGIQKLVTELQNINESMVDRPRLLKALR